MIPRKIHYCWFGGKPFSPLHLECFESWKRFLPDYDIVRWDELNSPLDAAPFVRNAFRAKKWAFVSDYVRIHVLLDEGGIYMDTDMLILKPLDPFLEHRAFAGFEDEENVNFAIWGSEPNHPFLRRLLERYDALTFDSTDLTAISIPRQTTQVLRREGLMAAGRQRVDDVDLYPPEYFYPWPFLICRENPDYRKFLTSETVAVHRWNHSWNPGVPLRRRFVLAARRILPAGIWNVLKRMKYLLYN